LLIEALTLLGATEMIKFSSLLLAAALFAPAAFAALNQAAQIVA